MSKLGELMVEKFELENRLENINEAIRELELEKYKYLEGKCFYVDGIRTKIIKVTNIIYRGDDEIYITYIGLQIGHKTITTKTDKNILLVIKANLISNEEFNRKYIFICLSSNCLMSYL